MMPEAGPRPKIRTCYHRIAMRLSDAERRAIVETARRVFGPTVEVRLFGSRTRDDARGGDIDLYIEADPERATLDNELRFERELLARIGEQRVDIVLQPRGRPPGPFARIAAKESVPL